MMAKTKTSDHMSKATAAVALLNGLPIKDKKMELAAFLSIFEPKMSEQHKKKLLNACEK